MPRTKTIQAKKDREILSNERRLSRRKFLKISGAVLGASALTCSGLGYLATRQPEIQLPETTYGDASKMNEKILVTYATRAGSTAEVAAAIAQALSAQGAAVDVLPVKNVKDLKGYRAVVLGSAVRIGQWLPEAVKFVQQNQAALNQMPAAFFTVHILNVGDDEVSRTARQAYLDSVRKFVTPRKAAFFAGVANWKKVSFLEGLMGKMVKAPEGDFRDWAAIRAWTEGLGLNGLAEA